MVSVRSMYLRTVVRFSWCNWHGRLLWCHLSMTVGSLDLDIIGIYGHWADFASLGAFGMGGFYVVIMVCLALI